MGGLFSHYKSVNAKRYSQDPANFAYGQDKVWSELSPLEKVSSMSQNFASKAGDFAVEAGKHVVQVGAGIADVAERVSPIEGIRNTVSGLQEVAKAPEGADKKLAYEKGFYESKARKTYWERVSGKELTNEDGTINWKAGREFIGNAMEAPTYLYSAAAGTAKELASKGLLTRILGRSIKALPEAGINTGLQALEQGNTEGMGKNFLANALIMSGISNIVGEIKLPAQLAKETISSVETQTGKALTAAEKVDIEDALKQGVKPDDIVANVKKVTEGTVTPDEVAEAVNKHIQANPTKSAGIISAEDQKLSKIYKESIANEDFMYGDSKTGANPVMIENGQLKPQLVQGRIDDVVQKMQNEKMPQPVIDKYIADMKGKTFADYAEFDKANRETFATLMGESKPTASAGGVAPAEAVKPGAEGTKVAKAASDIDKKIVSQGLDELPEEELAKYTPITKEKTINDVAEIMGDWEGSKKMAITGENIPGHIKNQVLFNAVKNKALKEGDYNLMRELAGSPIASERSLHAQELGSAAFNNETDDVVVHMQDVAKSREKAVLSRIKEPTLAKAQEKVIKEIKAKIPKIPKETWGSFIDSIKCNG